MKCATCGEEIGHNGKYWIHLSSVLPRHMVVLPEKYTLNDLSTNTKEKLMVKYQLESSNLKEVSYDLKWNTLYVTFKSNVTYSYEDVSYESVCKLLFSGSVGKEFNSNIKKHPFTKLS